MTEQRVLPADVYDALELSALAFGGIGAGSFVDDPQQSPFDSDAVEHHRPLCAKGHAAFLDGNGEVWVALSQAEIWAMDNDDAVHRINQRSGNAPNARVPFNKWCKELHVVRGA